MSASSLVADGLELPRDMIGADDMFYVHRWLDVWGWKTTPRRARG